MTTKELRQLLDDAARDVATADFLIEGIDVRIAQVVRARFGYVARSLELGIRAQDMVWLLHDPPGLPLSYVQDAVLMITVLGLEAAIAAEIALIEIDDGYDGHLVGRRL